MKSLFILLDIDNTLYEFSKTGFGEQMRDRIYEYVQKTVGVSAEEAQRTSKHYYYSYGLSLHGYVKHYGVDAKAYSDYVHQCSYEKLTPNEPLRAMLARLQYTSSAEGGKHHLYFFTNANRPHARNMLEPLGLKDIFTRQPPAGSPVREFHKKYDDEGFEDGVEWVGFSYEDQWRLTPGDNANKPMKPAYEGVFRAIDEEIALDEAMHRADPEAVSGGSPVDVVKHKRSALQPGNVVMVDDSIINLDAPLELGWYAVWVSYGAELPDKEVYKKAVAEGRLKIIFDVMGLEKVVEEISSA